MARTGAETGWAVTLRALAAAAGLWGPMAAAGADQPADVEALMALLGRVERVEAQWRETVESGLLDTVLSSRGHLTYEAPDRLRRLSEQQEGFVLDGERLQLITEGRAVRELAVADVKPLAAMIGAMQATFAGDLTRLRRDYRLDYRAPTATHWVLQLTPTDGTVATRLKQIELVGNGSAITTIEVEEPDGDRRRLQLELLTREPPGLP